MTQAESLYINGTWQLGEGTAFQSLDPSCNDVIWEKNSASPEQVAMAIASARSALPEWAQRSVEERIAAVERFSKQLAENKQKLATVIAQETGKPLWEALTEVGAMVGKTDVSKRAYFERTGNRESELPDGIAATRHKPHGVLAVFGPFNFPGHLPNGHIIPALIAGNTVVFKPSELTPKTAELTLEIWAKSGLPAGVINLVQGEVVCGQALARHPDIDGLLFTGSEKTGLLLQRELLEQPQKIVALELGGNNPLIVREVSQVEAAVYNTIQSAYITAGQRCTCARRLFVPAGQWGNQFLQVLEKAVSRILVGHWNDVPAPFMGPVISSQSAKRLIETQERWLASGAKPLVQAKLQNDNSGFISPGLIDTTEQQHDEEAFGPLLQVLRYTHFDAAIEQANATRFGLAAGLFSDDQRDYEHFYARIRAGIVNWNKQLTGASSSAPFGGIGNSGNFRPSAYYAADYCAYPVASLEAQQLSLPENLTPGITL